MLHGSKGCVVQPAGHQPDFQNLDLTNLWDCNVPDELLWNEPISNLAHHSFPL
jgi:hypothetical protein